MIAALLLGLVGSVTHCSGMCAGVMLLLGRRQGVKGWGLLALHAGRITTYTALGALAGALGASASAVVGHSHHVTSLEPAPAAGPLPDLSPLAGALALLAAGAAGYMALALLGRVPSPEILFARVTRWWGRTARATTGALPVPASAPAWALRTFLSGAFWGMLPCGMVLAALLLAAAAESPAGGALTMLAFGLGTLPLGLGLIWGANQLHAPTSWTLRLRPLAAAIVLLFGAQMALRGLAAWGWVAHAQVGALPLW
jgi:sulfite exporter TauE/SafE